MASFVAHYSQEVEAEGNNQFMTFEFQEVGPITFEKLNDPSATHFTVGDTLQAKRATGEIVGQYQYVGYYQDGIVISPDPSGTAFYLYGNTPSDPYHGFTINLQPFPVCFVKGTIIQTSRGAVRIEELVPGDSVQGSSGWRTVKWIGRRHYGSASFLCRESSSRIAPVRIRAHALADNVPSQDLLVSAWHHVFVDGKLVRAGDLVNTITITQETHLTEVTYYHVELDRFDILMAHGVYSESWADGGNRDFFENVDITTLRPEDKTRGIAPRPGFDHLVLRTGKELKAIQRRIAQRATDLSGITTAITAQKAA